MLKFPISNDLEREAETSFDALNGSAADIPQPNHGLQSKRGQNALRLELPKEKLSSPLHAETPLKDENEEEERKETSNGVGFVVKEDTRVAKALRGLSWIPNNFKLSRLRAVLRCSIGAWISVLLLIIPRTQAVLGRSSFLILAATFLLPPCDPFIAVLEREIVLQLTIAGAYAWSCLGIWLANMARVETNENAAQDDIVRGRYIEPAPSVICAIFLCSGTSILLYLRTKMGQGSFIIGTMILSCTALDSALTVAPLYPYVNYTLGRNVVIPVAFHSAIAILVSLFIFPESVHGRFRRRFLSVFTPLSLALRSQPEILCMGCVSERETKSFEAALALFHDHIHTAESALGGLRTVRHLMRRDIAYSRFGADDFKRVHELTRRMTVRAHGMSFYFKIMDPSRHRFNGSQTPGTFTPVQQTPIQSPPGSPPPTPSGHHGTNTGALLNAGSRSPTNSIASRRRRHGRRTGGHGHLHSPLHNLFLHFPGHMRLHGHHHGSGSAPFFAPSLDVHTSESGAVGVFESQAYLNLEARFAHPGADALRTRAMNLLGVEAGAGALLRCAADALGECGKWIERVDDDRLLGRFFKRLAEKLGVGNRKRMGVEDIVVKIEMTKLKLQACLEEFKREKRHLVLSMYRPTIDPNYPGTPSGEDPPPHRYLFQSYLYQYHLIQFVEDLIQLLDEIVRLECTRQKRRLWLPIRPFHRRWNPAEDQYDHEDEDPDVISGMEPSSTEDPVSLGGRRDPDALPPRNAFEAFGRMVYSNFCALGRGNCVFAFKAGIMAALLGLPAFLPTSATWALNHRFVWALVPGQTTLARFRGDTVFGLVSRILSTFFGGLTGLAMWYISSGNGVGNPYGLAAVTAICFPFFFFARIYYPGPPINVAFFFLTSQLVIGYSWQDTHLPSVGDVGVGLKVAWERFLLVTIGVFVAFIFSFLPPSTTLRKYLRTTYATTASQLGQLYCDVLSFAGARDQAKTEEISESLVSVRMKLNRSAALRRNVTYEFSLQGRWPAERYKKILDIQLEMAYLLSHLRSVEEHLEPQWARAFLRRTRFMEPEFQGDILSVFCMVSTALRTGAPLPQITPCPLLDRFVAHQYPQLLPHHGGIDHSNSNSQAHASSSSADEYGLPRSLTIDTLEDEQYLYFSVGVATAFGIITRLDRLMHATKELVGEQYQIHSVIDLLAHKRTEEKLYL